MSDKRLYGIDLFKALAMFLVVVLRDDGAGALSLFQGILVAEQEFVLYLCSLVATHLGYFLYALDAVFHGFEVFQLQLCVDDFLVAYGVHRAVHVDDVAIVEAAQHVDDGVALADVAQELVAESFTFAGALHQSGNVYDVTHGGYDTPRVNQLGELRQSFVGYGHLSHLGVDCTEREVCRLCLCAAQAVEKSGFSYVGKAHDTSF